MISVTFHLHGAKAFFAMLANELLESTIPIDAISDPGLIELQNYLIDTPDI